MIKKGEVAVELKHGFKSRWDHQTERARDDRTSSFHVIEASVSESAFPEGTSLDPFLMPVPLQDVHTAFRSQSSHSPLIR